MLRGVRQKTNRLTCRKLPFGLSLPGVQHTGQVKREDKETWGTPARKKQKRPTFEGRNSYKAQ